MFRKNNSAASRFSSRMRPAIVNGIGSLSRIFAPGSARDEIVVHERPSSPHPVEDKQSVTFSTNGAKVTDSLARQLLEASAHLAELDTVSDIVGSTLKSLAASTNIRSATLFLQSSTGTVDVWSVAHSGLSQESNVHSLGSFPADKAEALWQIGAPLSSLGSDAATDVQSAIEEFLPEQQDSSVATIPLTTANETIGCILLTSGSAIAQRDPYGIETFGLIAAGALRTAQSLAESNAKRQAMETLDSLTLTGLQSLDAEDLLQQLLEQGAKGVKADAASIRLLDAGDGTLKPMASLGLDMPSRVGNPDITPASNAAHHLQVDEHGTIAVGREAIRARLYRQELLDMGFGSFARKPIYFQNNLAGYIIFLWYDEHPPTDQELELIQMMADRVGASVERARLHQQVQQRLDQEIYYVRELSQANQVLLFQGQVMEQMTDSIIVTDLGSNVVYWSKRSEAIYGWASNEMMGESLDRLYPAEESVDIEGAHHGGASGGPVTLERRAETKDQSSIWTEVVSTVLLDSDGEAKGYLHISKDITERKHDEEQLLQTAKLRSLGQLASGIAHDLSNILMVIQGHSELSLENAKVDERGQKALKTILQAAANGAEVVRRIQSFYRPIDPDEIEPVDLNAVISTTVSHIEGSLVTLRPSLENKVVVDLKPQPLPYIAGNDKELGQIFANLMLNALDAMPKGGTLSIRTWREDKRAVVQVADTGMGMTEEVRSRIFDPFFTTKGEAGTGLGLSITHGIVLGHGGEISVESTPGIGTKFSVNFPLFELENTPHALPEPTAADIVPLRVAVIDDDPFVAQTIEDLLEDMGHTVAVALSGREGVRMALKGNWDVICTDLGMKDMDGWEVLRTLREKLPETPVYLLTGYGFSLDPERVEKMGAAGVLTKPVSMSTLQNALQRHAGGRNKPAA